MVTVKHQSALPKPDVASSRAGSGGASELAKDSHGGAARSTVKRRVSGGGAWSFALDALGIDTAASLLHQGGGDSTCTATGLFFPLQGMLAAIFIFSRAVAHCTGQVPLFS